MYEFWDKVVYFCKNSRKLRYTHQVGGYEQMKNIRQILEYNTTSWWYMHLQYIVFQRFIIHFWYKKCVDVITK